jgi:hypothetical protein
LCFFVSRTKAHFLYILRSFLHLYPVWINTRSHFHSRTSIKKKIKKTSCAKTKKKVQIEGCERRGSQPVHADVRKHT